MFRLKETISAQLVIDIDRATVWRVISDLPSYPEWNPQVLRWDGTLRPGARTRETIRTSSGREFTFTPKILTVDPDREITQRAHTLVPGLFTGTHTFRLEDTPAGGCLVTKHETLSGFCVLFLPRRVLRRSAEEFKDVLVALAAEAARHETPGVSDQRCS